MVKAGNIRLRNEASIVQAAIEEFSQRGFRGASMQRIAEGAGVARTNIHYYFKSKELLYARVITSIVDMWNDSFDLIQVDDDPAEALEQYIRAKLHYSRTEPKLSRIFANEIIHGAPHIEEYLHGDLREWLNTKAEVIQAWIDKGLMQPVNPLHLIFMIWSVTQHYADFSTQVCAVMAKDELSEADYDAIARDVTTIILRGCGLETAA